VATIGPASESEEILRGMIEAQMDVARLNFSWGTVGERTVQIERLRRLAREAGKRIPIIQDLPGPRVNHAEGHGYDPEALKALTDADKDFIRFGAERGLEYIAVSFVGNADDIRDAREAIRAVSGTQRIIAKIERKVALDNLDEIIEEADAVMIARGDLGDDIPLEEVPFVQADITKRCNKAGKPVITATEMFVSMVESLRPSRAEVTDVENAVLIGSDAVMLSEETARGAHPVEAVALMERVVIEAERHRKGRTTNLL
jgi:pyruvate kinase